MHHATFTTLFYCKHNFTVFNCHYDQWFKTMITAALKPFNQMMRFLVIGFKLYCVVVKMLIKKKLVKLSCL